jgi:hypothetical protein
MGSTSFPDAAFGVVPGDVCLSQDADQVMAVDDRQPADLVVLHILDRVFNPIIRADGHGLALTKAPAFAVCGSPPSAKHLMTMSR